MRRLVGCIPACRLGLLLVMASLGAPSVSAQTSFLDVAMEISQKNLSLAELTTLLFNTTIFNETMQAAALSDTQYAAFSQALIAALGEQLGANTVDVQMCRVGFYALDTVCVPCPAGTYSVTEYATSPLVCQFCGRGTFSTTLGANGSAACLPCPSGSYSSVMGGTNSSVCVSCTAGASAAAGSQDASACSCMPGYYLSEGVCTECPAGFYCNNNQMFECPLHNDVDGAMSDSLTMSASEGDCFCKAGYFGTPSADGEQCQLCTAGSWCPGNIPGDSPKNNCPDQSTSLSGSYRQSDCVCRDTFKRSTVVTAVRTFQVDATPCNCSRENEKFTCASTEAARCTSGTESGQVDKDRNFTCKSGYFNWAAGSSGSTYGNSRWVIAPVNATKVTIFFSFFRISNGDTLTFRQCKNLSNCQTPASIGGGTVITGTQNPFSVTTTVSGNGVIVIDFAKCASCTWFDGFGWTARYSSMQPCEAGTIPMTLTSLKYSNVISTITNPQQTDPTWPIVAWLDDRLVFSQIDDGSGTMVTVNIMRNGVSQLGDAGLTQWYPPSVGVYSVVDPAVVDGTRARKLVVMPKSARTLVVYYTVTSTAITLSGDIAEAGSPDIVLVQGDRLELRRMSSTEGIVVVRSTQTMAPVTEVLGQSSASVAMPALTWDTTGNAPGEYYYTSAASPGNVRRGRILVYAKPSGLMCVACEANEYCNNGNPMNCPANSQSPRGSVGISNCTCSKGFAREMSDISRYINSQTVDSGGQHSCVITQDEKLVCWGANGAGQLGRNTRSVWELPGEVPDFAGVKNVSLGLDFTCAVYGANLKTKCFGSNWYGQLGLDSSAEDSVGTAVKDQEDARLNAGGEYNTLNLQCGGHSCCAVVYKVVAEQTGITCWGRGGSGQLGDTTQLKNVGTGTDGTFNSGNARHSYALTGTEWLTTNGWTPLAVTMGGTHACALSTARSVYCWGSNLNGALGRESSLGTAQSVAAVNLGSGVLAKTVNCFGLVCCVVTERTFEVKCWGQGAGGRLGTGVYDVGSSTGSMGNNLQSVPMGTNKYAMDVNVGQSQTCALLWDNSVKCWGTIGSTVIGDTPPTEMHDYLPSLTLQSGSVALQVSGKGSVTCAVMSSYSVVCWGPNDMQQLGGVPLAGNTANMTLVALASGVTALRSSGSATTLSCIMCAPGTYCDGSGGAAVACPANTNSPAMSSSSSDCKCLPGMKGDGSRSCEVCSGKFYCMNGVENACPLNSTTNSPASSSITQCMCDPGFTGTSMSGCSKCAAGLYKSENGSGACVPCPGGTFSSAVGLSSVAGCAECPSGYYSGSGAQSCSLCANGFTAKRGSSVCEQCTAGFFSFVGSDGCVACPAGTYDAYPFSGTNDTCTPCDPGTASSTLNATSVSVCKVCGPGTISAAGSSACSPCGPGLFSMGNTGVCEGCPGNSTSAGGTGRSGCTCLAGYHKVFKDDGVLFQCDPCPGGRYSDANASVCSACPAGTSNRNLAADSVGKCVACSAGTFAAAGSTVCSPCPTWSFSGSSAAACTNCSRGQWAGSGATVCGACAPGRYSFNPITSSSGCVDCPRGAYCPGFVVAGSDGQVVQCGKGKFQNNTGISAEGSCVDCTADYYCPMPTLRFACPPGTGSAAGSSSQLQCVCRAGYTCSYSKVINAVITLLMNRDSFNTDVQQKLKEAVAAASSAKPSNVNIISVTERSGVQGGARRRMLSREDEQTHVFLEVRGSGTDSIVDLNGRLVEYGLGESVDHAWFSPHNVDVVAI